MDDILKLHLRTLLFALSAAAILIAPLAAVAGQNMDLSKEMITLIRQGESTYLGKFGMGANEAVNNDPLLFAAILGLALQRQGNYADQQQQYVDHYWVLRKQCTALLERVARIQNYRNPVDGSSMSAERLIEDFHIALKGNMNAQFISRYGIDPATVNLPMILAQVPVPNKLGPAGPNYKLPVLQENDGIVLGGETAPPAESSTPMIIGPGTTGNIPENAIQGTWVSEKGNVRLTFHRQQNAYVAHINYSVQRAGGGIGMAIVPVSVTYTLTRSEFIPTKDQRISWDRRVYYGMMEGTDNGKPFRREMKLDVTRDPQKRDFRLYTGYLHPPLIYHFFKR
jgi:hypothetical protein